MTFSGQEIYSENPDSILSYLYLADSLIHIPQSRQYFQYQNLGDDKVYFRYEKYTYFAANDEWLLTNLFEEWYHLKTILDLEKYPDAKACFSIFPNPCKAGQNLNLKHDSANGKKIEIYVFDIQGFLISKEILTDRTTFQAPLQSGIYTIMLRDKKRLIGVSKQIVVE